MPTARINDINVYYELHGAGPDLLLLHGLGSNVADWEEQLPVLSARYRVIAPDLRGFGRTDVTPGPYSIEGYRRDVSALLDHLGVTGTHVLGFSMGGAIAFQLAVDEPARVRSLIVVNSQPSFEVDHWRKHLMVLTRIGMARLMGMERMVRFLAKRLFPLPEQTPLREQYIARHVTNDRDAYLAAVNALRGWSVVDRIGGIGVPVLMIVADQDYTPLDEKRQYLDRMPDARIVLIEDSRHASHIDQPEAFSHAVLSFLDDVEGGGAPRDKE